MGLRFQEDDARHAGSGGGVHGTFRAPDRDREVTMYGAGRTTLQAGQQVPAIDVAGRPWRVYPPSGSREWLVVATVLAAAIVLLIPLTRHLLRQR